MAQVRLRLLRLGDWRTIRVATWTAGLAVAAASVPAVLTQAWLRTFFSADDRASAILAAIFVAPVAGCALASLFNRGAKVLAFAAATRRRTIVLTTVLSVLVAAVATSELAGAGKTAELWIAGVTLGSLVIVLGILGVRDSTTVWLNLGAIVGLTILLVGLPAARRKYHISSLATWGIVGESLFALAIASGCAWLVLRWMRGLRPRWRWLRVPVAAALAGYPLSLLLTGQLLGGIAEVALLPILATVVVVGWRAMARSRRLAVSGAADAVGALGLGVVAVLTLAWLANVLDLPRAEVDAIKGVASQLREAIDVPWWLWALVYGALTGAQLALAFGPRWATGIRSWVRRVTAGVKLGARTGSITSTVLMFAAFVAAVAPVAVAPVLANRIRAHYTVSLSAQADAERQEAVGEAVTRAFSAPNPPVVQVLRTMLADIHSIDQPSRIGDGPTVTEVDLARQLGLLQGTVRNKATAQSLVDAAAEPLPDTADLTERLTAVQAQDERVSQRQQAADEAADLAARTVTAVLDSIPLPFGMDRIEVFGLVRSYLQGLAESPIGEVFRNWTRRAAGDSGSSAGPAPDAVSLVEPNARLLAIEASLQFLQTRLDTKAGASSTADNRVQQELQQDPLLAAVDLANQTRFLRTGTGVCAGCSHPGDIHNRFEEPGHEVRPREPVGRR
jgi:hypothetical protein